MFIKFDKKAISSMVAVSIFVVISILSIIGFQTWFGSYVSGISSDLETETNTMSDEIFIDSLIGNNLYVNVDSSQGMNITKLVVENVECNISKNLNSNINLIDLNVCLNGINRGKINVVLVTENEVIEKNFYLKDKVSPTLLFNSNITNIEQGGSVNLSWSGNYVNSCVAYGDWSGSKSISGNEVQTNILVAKTYYLNCSDGIGSNIIESVTIIIDPLDDGEICSLDSDCLSGNCDADFDDGNNYCHSNLSNCIDFNLGSPWEQVSGYELCSGDSYYKGCTNSLWSAEQYPGSAYCDAGDGVTSGYALEDTCNSGLSGGFAAASCTSCSPYLANSTSSCANSCVDDGDCWTGFECNATSQCDVPKCIGGYDIGGACYYWGADGVSCQTVCSGKGGDVDWNDDTSCTITKAMGALRTGNCFQAAAVWGWSPGFQASTPAYMYGEAGRTYSSTATKAGVERACKCADYP